MKKLASAQLRAVIYARVSKNKQKGQDSRSVEQQVEWATGIRDREGWLPGPVITDTDISASRYSKKHRKGYAELLKTLQPGDVLIIWEQSRSTRRPREWYDLRDLCVERGVILCSGGEILDLSNSSTRLSTGIKAVVSEHESDLISDRVKRDIGKAALRGDPHGLLGFGFEKVYAKDGSWHWEENQAQAHAIRWATTHLLGGGSMGAVRREWKRLGIRTPQSDSAEWAISQIRAILRTPRLAGLRTLYGEVIREGTWPAIISRDEHDMLVALFASKKLTSPRGRRPKALLSGVMPCGVCSGRVTAFQRRRRTTNVPYMSYRCAINGCVSREVTQVDKLVGEKMQDLLNSWQADTFLFDANEPSPDQNLSDINDQIEGLQKRLAEFQIASAKGQLSVSALIVAEGEIVPQIEALTRQKASAMTSPLMALLARSAGQLWTEMEKDEQRELIRLTADVRLLPIGRGVAARDAESIAFEAKPIDRAALTELMLAR